MLTETVAHDFAVRHHDDRAGIHIVDRPACCQRIDVPINCHGPSNNRQKHIRTVFIFAGKYVSAWLSWNYMGRNFANLRDNDIQ